MTSFTVRPYEPGDEEGIVSLFNRVFSEDNPAFKARSVENWSSIYLDNPAGIQVFVAVGNEGDIIGNYSSIPSLCTLWGRAGLSTQAVDTCVDRRYRGRLSKGSVFVTIARSFIEHFSREGKEPFDDYMWGLPNEQAFPVGTRIIGYQPVRCPMPVWSMDLESEWVETMESKGAGCVIENWDMEGAADLAERLYLAHADEAPLGLRKDAAMLRWRYRPREDVQYGVFVAKRDAEAVGLLVYRLGWMDQPLVPLVDWLGGGADVEATAGLLGAVGKVAVEKGGRRLETWVSPTSPRATTLSTLGFEKGDSPFNLCIMTFAPEFRPDWSREDWSVTMGDSDIY